jgi:non-lysosomal glucosylceramidase
MMKPKQTIGRRSFLKQAAGVVGAAARIGALPAPAQSAELPKASASDTTRKGVETRQISFPRVFSGRQIKQIAFPLGGVAAGSLSLGGRGQLRDWEIFNRPNKGYSPSYGFPALWVQSGSAEPIARVLEARILPPYSGESGLGSANAPGLSRIANAEFIGAYPLALIRFRDSKLPVQIELEAFSPFIPHDPDDSGLPVAIMRYRIRNPRPTAAKIALAFSIENPVTASLGKDVQSRNGARVNEYRASRFVEGLVMSNPALDPADPMQGTFVLSALRDSDAHFTHWKGWPRSPWWNAPMFFWDAFSRDGALLQEPAEPGPVGALCVRKSIDAGHSASFTFVLTWHFPYRTPEWCGWQAPEGEGGTVIGNYYCTRFRDAWEVAEYTAANLDRLESRTRAFARVFAESTLPAAVKDAASANLSTLATPVCFRTADGEFHAFEGASDHIGCCFGNCTHVWNYETATAYLFPMFARSLRKSAFGYSMDELGGMRFRQLLPDGKERYDLTAADGQMGQIIHAYLDWKLSGDSGWLRDMWPRIKKAISFPWVQYGWDPDGTGVLTGVQHNTYDVEFFGPNPLCGIYYLGALRACEEMARTMGENDSTTSYRALFDKGRNWIDTNLFQGEYYIQQVRGYPVDQIAPHLCSGMSNDSSEHPQYQVGPGCLADQLIGQYLAYIAGLGPLVSPEHVRTTMESIYRYNYKPTLVDYNSVQRTYALNDEAALTVCDYGKATRPHIPFPYYAEAWTSHEYLVASLMFHVGMISEGIEMVTNARARFDGAKRNPWDEEECGHHYARAMSSWSTVVALCGFHYAGDRAAVSALPLIGDDNFRGFWATGTGWGSFSLLRSGGRIRLVIDILAGTLPCRSCTVKGTGANAKARLASAAYSPRVEEADGRVTLHFAELLKIEEGTQLEIEVGA